MPTVLVPSWSSYSKLTFGTKNMKITSFCKVLSSTESCTHSWTQLLHTTIIIELTGFTFAAKNRTRVCVWAVVEHILTNKYYSITTYKEWYDVPTTETSFNQAKNNYNEQWLTKTSLGVNCILSTKLPFLTNGGQVASPRQAASTLILWFHW